MSNRWNRFISICIEIATLQYYKIILIFLKYDLYCMRSHISRRGAPLPTCTSFCSFVFIGLHLDSYLSSDLNFLLSWLLLLDWPWSILSISCLTLPFVFPICCKHAFVFVLFSLQKPFVLFSTHLVQSSFYPFLNFLLFASEIISSNLIFTLLF